MRAERPVVNVQSATAEYFRTVGIPLRAGRTFSDEDREGEPRVAVINEQLARLFWPSYPRGPSPIGQHLLAGGRETSVEIVGVSGDVHEDALAADVKPEVCFSAAQLSPQTGYLLVKTATGSGDLGTAVRHQVAGSSPAARGAWNRSTPKSALRSFWLDRALSFPRLQIIERRRFKQIGRNGPAKPWHLTKRPSSNRTA